MGYSTQYYGMITWAISIVTIIIGLILYILLISNLSHIFQLTGDPAIKTSRNLFIGQIFAVIYSYFSIFLSANLFSSLIGMYFIVSQYIPNFIINFLKLAAWVNLSKHFKNQHPLSKAKTGTSLIVLSGIPVLLMGVINIGLTILIGPILDWSSVFTRIISITSGGLSFISEILSTIGYIILIGALVKMSVPPSTQFAPTPYGVQQTYLSPEEPILSQPRFCSQCGARNAPGSSFCTQCGHNMKV